MLKIVEVSDAQLAFPANVVGILPEWKDIPERFKRDYPEANATPQEKELQRKAIKWRNLFSDWFFGGVQGLELYPREGVDPEKACRMIQSCMRSFQPKHEHKHAGVAYMFDEFFEDAKWEKGAAKAK